MCGIAGHVGAERPAPERIEAALRALGLTQVQVARRLGTVGPRVVETERDRGYAMGTSPRAGLQERIARLLTELEAEAQAQQG